jgi:hypothetical protein
MILFSVQIRLTLCVVVWAYAANDMIGLSNLPPKVIIYVLGILLVLCVVAIVVVLVTRKKPRCLTGPVTASLVSSSTTGRYTTSSYSFTTSDGKQVTVSRRIRSLSSHFR